VVISQLAGIQSPSRTEKRNGIQLAKWYSRFWPEICPWLAVVQLRDDSDRPIDAFRELSEKGLIERVNPTSAYSIGPHVW
jgi:hypothetical protein